MEDFDSAQLAAGYFARAVEESVFAQDVEETFLSSVVVAEVVSTVHESTSQHHSLEYFSVVYYPNSTSTLNRRLWQSTFAS